MTLLKLIKKAIKFTSRNPNLFCVYVDAFFIDQY